MSRYIIGVWESDDGKRRIVSYDVVEKEYYCTCEGFWYRKWCSHIDKLKGFVDVAEGRQMRLIRFSDIQEGKKVKKSEIGVKAIDKLFDYAPLTTDSMLAIYGESMAGKTIMALQISAYMISKGVNVLYIDTEGGVMDIAQVWMPKFAERFGLKMQDIDKRFLLAKILDIKEMFELFGKKVKLEIKNSKVEVSITEFTKAEKKNKLMFDDIVKENKIGMVVIDSLSSLFRVIPSNPQNFPARADLEAQLFYELIKLQDKRGIYLVVLHQSSQNPMAYDNRQELRGGMTVKYFSKKIMYIDKSQKKKYEGYRRIWIIRGENAGSWSRVAVVKITDEGYVDLTPQEATEVKADILTNGESQYSRLVWAIGDEEFKTK